MCEWWHHSWSFSTAWLIASLIAPSEQSWLVIAFPKFKLLLWSKFFTGGIQEIASDPTSHKRLRAFSTITGLIGNFAVVLFSAWILVGWVSTFADPYYIGDSASIERKLFGWISINAFVIIVIPW